VGLVKGLLTSTPAGAMLLAMEDCGGTVRFCDLKEFSLVLMAGVE
jgi:hypothetical protein